MTSTGTVRLEVDEDSGGKVATLVLDDPTRRNAMGRAMYATIPDLVAEVDGSPDIRVLLLRGEGREAFCAGSNIAEFRDHRLGDAHLGYDEVEHRATDALAACRVPVVACIRGACMGGGVGLALAADLRYAADDALFSVPPGFLGIGYSLDSVERLLATVGRSSAAELLLTARRLDAYEARRIGLIHDVVTADQLDEVVAERCTTIAALAPMTLRAARAALAGRPDAAALTEACFHSADLVEGITAFEQSRRPQFGNR